MRRRQCRFRLSHLGRRLVPVLDDELRARSIARSSAGAGWHKPKGYEGFGAKLAHWLTFGTLAMDSLAMATCAEFPAPRAAREEVCSSFAVVRSWRKEESVLCCPSGKNEFIISLTTFPFLVAVTCLGMHLSGFTNGSSHS